MPYPLPSHRSPIATPIDTPTGVEDELHELRAFIENFREESAKLWAMEGELSKLEAEGAMPMEGLHLLAVGLQLGWKRFLHQ